MITTEEKRSSTLIHNIKLSNELPLFLAEIEEKYNV